MNDSEIELAIEEIAEAYQDDWVFMAEHGLGIWTWSKMREIIRSVQHNPKTIVTACHGSSKTFTGASISGMFFDIYTTFAPKEKTKVITTAPTFMQVDRLLWTEINQLYRNSRIRLNGECLQTQIKIPELEESFAIGFSTDKPAKSEGWHAWNLLFVLDEGKGIAPWMWETVSAQSGGGNSKVLVLSTTDGVEPGSEFHNAATSPLYDEWSRVHIDCFDLPSFTGEKFRRYKWNDEYGFDFDREEARYEDLRIQISTPEWEKERGKQWGKDSVLYLTKCRGKIVDELPDQIIPLWKVEKMYENWENPDFDDSGVLRVGIDVARMGTDSTAAWLVKGLKVIKGIEINKMEGFEIVEQLEKNGILPNKQVEIKVDDTGVGGIVTGELKRKGYEKVIPVVFNQTPNDKDHYQYAIDEMWYTLADMIDRIACQRNDELTKQLTSRKKAKMTERGQLKVEKKDDYKKRTNGKSPDLADGFLLTFYKPMKEDEGGFEVSTVALY